MLNTLRRMQRGDIPFGLALCRRAGWNQLDADWRRLLSLCPDGVMVAEQDGMPCGTASAICYDTRIAWIGMILVHPDFRQQGIGSALMKHTLARLQSRRSQVIKLDATDQGRPVYLKLGFKDERPICRFVGQAQGGTVTERAVTADDWPVIAQLDAEAFGADRLALLHALAHEGFSAVVANDSGLQAVGFARLGFEANFLGPVIARDLATARRAVSSLLAALPAGNVYWDLLPDNRSARQLAEDSGLIIRRELTRMYLGHENITGTVDRVYGCAGFELG